ncbi:MAG: bile acid:sodium symporter family protein [Verrucomicrobia bacterium]|nr:bile acid:sodium symporter family protein [Verrucomicrobiota bacterium]
MLSFALASGGFERTRNWSLLVWLSTAIVVGMSFPAWFIGVGDFKFTRLFMPLLQLIMFCMGTTLSLNDFSRVVRMPGGVFVGVFCQFTIMPLLGYALARLSGFPPEIGAGIVLVGCVPSGLASTVMVYLARANVALSVTLTAMTSLMAPFVTPFLMQWLAGQMVQIDAGKLMLDLVKMTVLPVTAGLIWHHWVRDRAQWLSRIMPYFSMAGIVAMTVLTVAVGRDNLIKLGLVLVAICLVHTTSGYLLGYLVCRTLRFNEATCRTIAFEVGMQNAGMASAVAASLNKVATFGLAPIVFGPVMNLTASTLANWWRSRPEPSTPERNECQSS